MEKKQEIKWVNCAKFMAIIAVLIDHSNGILYVNREITYASYYSVSLFIIISGMMSYLSNQRHEYNWHTTFLKSVKNIVYAYFLASFIYFICIYHSFDLIIYLQHIISFNLSGPFYYVLLYLQLMLVSKFMYKIIVIISGKYNIFGEIALGIVLLFISSWTTNYTNILGVYGGGKLLGGTYLFLFYIGMLLSKYNFVKEITLKKAIIVSSISIGAWLI